LVERSEAGRRLAADVLRARLAVAAGRRAARGRGRLVRGERGEPAEQQGSGEREAGEARRREGALHGTLTEQVAATGVVPSVARASTIVQLKSPDTGACAPSQSVKFILKRVPGRGLIAVAFVTTTVSA